nr:reverse transcriptase domain-containing protein [Tanacetum cinerariifolium]
SRAKAVVAKVNWNSSTPAISSDVDELKEMVRALLLDKKNKSSAPATSPTPAPMVANQVRPPGFPHVQNSQNNFNRGNNFTQNRWGNFNQSAFNQSQLHRSQIGRALIDVHNGELTLRIKNEAITYNLDQTSRYLANYDQMTLNKIDVTDEAYEEYFQEVLGFSNVTVNGSPTPSDDPIVELKDLPPHLKYAYLEGDNKLPVIIAKELGEEEKTALIKVLKFHKRAIAWKLSDIQ